MNFPAGTSNGFTSQPRPITSGTSPVAGCVVAVTPSNATGKASGATGLLLLSGGALVAVNDTAHTLYPTLPHARAHAVAPTYQVNTGTSG